MKPKTSIRLFIFVIIASISMILLASARSKVVAKECPDSEKCDQYQVQTEFVIWETISRPLFGHH
jgi:hypothetical protein